MYVKSYLVNGGAHVEGRFGAAVIDLSKGKKIRENQSNLSELSVLGTNEFDEFLNYPVVLRQKINVVKDEAVEASERF